MKKFKNWTALLLCFTLILSLAGCKKNNDNQNDPTTAPTSTSAPTPTTAAEGEDNDNDEVVEPVVVLPDVPADRRDASARSTANSTVPLVISSGEMDGKFSPFFATSEYDSDIYGWTQIGFITNNENGEPVAGVGYNTAAWDFEMTTNADQTQSTYKFYIKNGIQFSDGEVLNADDVLFNMYTYLDPKYDGSSTMYSLDIVGLKAYQTQILDETSADTKLAEFVAAGTQKVEDALAGTGDAAVLDKVWEIVDGNLRGDASTLKAYQYAPADFGFEQPEDYLDTAADSIILFYTGLNIGVDLISYKDGSYVFDEITGMSADGMSGYTIDDYINASMTAIKANITPVDFDEAFGYDSVDVAKDYYIAEEKALFLEANKGTVKSISGITKSKEVCSDGVEREVITIVLDGVDPTAIWKFSFSIAPMHYYAGQERHDNANGVDYFGVDFSSTEFINYLKEKNGIPMGAGPYKITDANGSENPTADKFYENGICYFMANDNFALSAPNIKYLRIKTITSGSELDAVLTKDVHYSDPQAKPTSINLITSDASYSHLDYALVDNLGYGYIGVNGALIKNVNERRAIMHAMDTSLTLATYPGGLAAIIHRPQSQVSWAYPDGAEAMYPYDETGEASKQLFIAAGFVEQADGTLLGPDGQKKTYTFTLPSNTSDHPAGQVFLKTQEVLAKLGIEVIIDIDSSVLSKLNEGIIEVWAAAWSSTIDPDMFQVYYSDPDVNQAGSPKATGLYEMYKNGSDEEKAILTRLNELIVQGRSSLNVDERKPIYAEALDKAMEIAVELPTYQRKNMYVYNKTVIDASSLIPADQITPYKGPLGEIWNVSLLDQ